MKKSDKEKKEYEHIINELSKEKEDYKEKYIRALADYQNLQKRSEQKIIDARKYSEFLLLEDLLEIFDTLEKLSIFVKNDGLDLTIKQFKDFFNRHQVNRIDVLNKEFDPEKMECVEVVMGDEDGIVIEEVLSGYLLKDRVLRIAKVKVSKKEQNS